MDAIGTPSVRHQCRSEPWNAARNGQRAKVIQLAEAAGDLGMMIAIRP
jgi:hypothetical protein